MRKIAVMLALGLLAAPLCAQDLAAFEIWNEPDQINEQYWAGPNKIANYVALTKAVYPAIKRVAPQVPVLAGSFVGGNGKWLQALYAAGIKGYYDALSVHFYDLTLSALSTTRAVQKANGDSKPLWLAEFGFTSCYTKGGPAFRLDHACNTGDTARALHVHMQTLRYRLRQLEEVFGKECLEDGDKRLELQLALKVRRETA
jgi:hypothetical protein